MQEAGFWVQAVPLLLIFTVFYCAVIRPGRLSEAKRWHAVKSLVGGEAVLLECGIVGTFVERRGDVDHGEYIVEVAPSVRVEVREQGIKTVLVALPVAQPEPVLPEPQMLEAPDPVLMVPPILEASAPWPGRVTLVEVKDVAHGA